MCDVLNITASFDQHNELLSLLATLCVITIFLSVPNELPTYILMHAIQRAGAIIHHTTRTYGTPSITTTMRLMPMFGTPFPIGIDTAV